MVQPLGDFCLVSLGYFLPDAAFRAYLAVMHELLRRYAGTETVVDRAGAHAFSVDLGLLPQLRASLVALGLTVAEAPSPISQALPKDKHQRTSVPHARLYIKLLALTCEEDRRRKALGTAARGCCFLSNQACAAAAGVESKRWGYELLYDLRDAHLVRVDMVTAVYRLIYPLQPLPARVTRISRSMDPGSADPPPHDPRIHPGSSPERINTPDVPSEGDVDPSRVAEVLKHYRLQAVAKAHGVDRTYEAWTRVYRRYNGNGHSLGQVRNWPKIVESALRGNGSWSPAAPTAAAAPAAPGSTPGAGPSAAAPIDGSAIPTSPAAPSAAKNARGPRPSAAGQGPGQGNNLPDVQTPVPALWRDLEKQLIASGGKPAAEWLSQVRCLRADEGVLVLEAPAALIRERLTTSFEALLQAAALKLRRQSFELEWRTLEERVPDGQPVETEWQTPEEDARVAA